MGKTLIITEKPSVAADIARALGGFKRHKDYYEHEKYLLSWAVGHLFELAVPEEMKARDKWDLSVLPIIPDHFDLKPNADTRARVNVLCKLIRDSETTAIINACDAGREGELIFRYIIQYAKTNKPIYRLWLQSMTPEAIREAFERLRSDAEMQPLAQAARSRNEADWLVGINATRAFTLRLRRGKGHNITTLGRVQTPTLAIIVDRESKIQQFTPRSFWELKAQFSAAAGTYEGKWFDEQFSKDEPEEDRLKRLLARVHVTEPDLDRILSPENGSLWPEHRQASRLWIAALARAIAEKCSGKKGIVESEDKKPTSQAPPLLYDLTTLQRDANTKLGMSAQRTLQIAQALYEKHKLITYPRTDSRCLPEDYLATSRNTLRRIGQTQPIYAAFAEKILQNQWVKPNKRVFNNAKVSDHFAIIPTGQVPNELSQQEGAIYDLIVRRFLAVFYPPAEYEVTTRITRVEGEPFKTEGRILVNPGWLEVYGRAVTEETDSLLPPVTTGETVQTIQTNTVQGHTNPPPRFTEATILTAMEAAGQLVEDEDLREAMKERGLGTPATRAQIIENLIDAGYLVRHGKELRPTPKAITTIGLLRKIVPELTSPQMTGEWEFKLRKIEQGQYTRAEFMDEIKRLAAEIVQKAKSFDPNRVTDTDPVGACPRCSSPIIEQEERFRCSNPACDVSIPRTLAGRTLSRSELLTLLTTRRLGPLDGFITRGGRPFAAVLNLDDSYRVRFEFPNNNAGAVTSEPAASTGPNQNEPVGTCPKCGAHVLESERRYTCEKALSDRSCDFSCSKTILQLPIPREQMVKLLNSGRTDLLKGFVSKRGRRFNAYLVLAEGGRVVFQFEDRNTAGAATD